MDLGEIWTLHYDVPYGITGLVGHAHLGIICWLSNF